MTFSTASGLSVKRLLTWELFPDRKWKSKITRSEATTQGRDSGGRLAPRSLPWRRGCTPGAHAACPCSATRSPSVLPPPCQHPLVSLVSPSRPPAGGTCSHWHRAERPHVLQLAAPFPNAGTWDQALALPGPSCPLPDRPLQDRPVPARTVPSPLGPSPPGPSRPRPDRSAVSRTTRTHQRAGVSCGHSRPVLCFEVTRAPGQHFRSGRERRCRV